MITIADWALQSRFSDPGRFAPLLRDVPAGVHAVSSVARNLIVHYRHGGVELPAERRSEIDSRWIETLLAVDQARHPGSLHTPRPAVDRVAGCCRDHSLFAVAVLREHGVPARTRVGFSHYFDPVFRHDHVVVEYHDGSRWIRFDPELTGGLPFDPHDIPVGPDAPFETAAEAWLAHRFNRIEATDYGVSPGSELSGPGFIRTYVIFEIAHRYGDELLLWDGWAATEASDDESTIDQFAMLLVAADAGEDAAEQELYRRYDEELRPGGTVTQYSPYGHPPVTVNLRGGPGHTA